MISLEADLQLAEQRVVMLEKAQKEDDNGDLRILKQQLIHKSELLDKVKQLLTRAAMNEKTLRQRVRIQTVFYLKDEVERNHLHFNLIIIIFLLGATAGIEAKSVNNSRVLCNSTYATIMNILEIS